MEQDQRLSFPGGRTDAEPSVFVTHPDRTAFLSELANHLRDRQGFTVATINLDHVVKLGENPAFRAAYASHSHVVADGNPIVWLSRIAGQKVDLIPGSELIDPLCAAAAAARVPVAFVGSTKEALDQAAAKLENRHPGLDVALRIAPPFGFDPAGPEVDDISRQLANAETGLCLLALGAPKQERLAIRLAENSPRCGFVSIGAGLDFQAGLQKRAPAWVRRIAAEWIWRLMSNPGRLARRYGACILIMPHLIGAAIRTRRNAARPN